MITQYNFSDNPNIPRILDTIKRDYNIDLELDYVIEQIAQCLRLIGINTYQEKELKIKPKNGQISIPCYIEDIKEVNYCNQPVEFSMDNHTIFISDNNAHTSNMFDDREIVVKYKWFPIDNNGFPKILDEEAYYACVHFCLYTYFLKKFVMGVESGERLSFIKDLKDRYILQARAKYKPNERKELIDTMYSTYNRHRRWR